MRSIRLIVLTLVLLGSSGRAEAGDAGCPAHVETTGVTATFYDPLIEGQCSLPIAPGEHIGAVADDDYDGSAPCGRCVRVTGPEGSTTVRIVDVCESELCTAGHLDLSPEAFDAIGDPTEGIVPIGWETVGCDVAGNMQLQLEGSNPFYLKVQLQNHRYGIETVEMRDGAGWVAMSRSLDNHFIRTGAGAPYGEPYRFRITDVHGQQVETGDIALLNDVPLDTGVQLVTCPEPAVATAWLSAFWALGLCCSSRDRMARRIAWSQRARFPRSEPQASGDFTRLAQPPRAARRRSG